MYYVYILKNKDNTKLYVGFSENLKERIKDHTGKSVKTTKDGEYKLVWYCAFETKNKALEFERYLNHGSGFAFSHKRLV